MLNQHWQWLNIVKPPQVKRLPDILTPTEVSIISLTHKLRYQVCFLTLYSMGLRLGEAVSLQVDDIDSQLMQVHIRDAKGGKDRLVPLPKRPLRHCAITGKPIAIRALYFQVKMTNQIH